MYENKNRIMLTARKFTYNLELPNPAQQNYPSIQKINSTSWTSKVRKLILKRFLISNECSIWSCENSWLLGELEESRFENRRLSPNPMLPGWGLKVSDTKTCRCSFHSLYIHQVSGRHPERGLQNLDIFGHGGGRELHVFGGRKLKNLLIFPK